MSTKIVIIRSPITSIDCTTTELRLKEKEMPAYALEKDAGFCSGGDEDDSEESNQTNSDDSGVKTDPPIKAGIKNKRKCAEPYKLIVKNEELPMAPLKKRIRFETEIDAETSRSSIGSDHKQQPMTSPDSGAQLDVHSDNSASPFRPWSLPGRSLGLSPENVVSLKYASSTSQSPPSPSQFPIAPFHLQPHTLIPHVTRMAQQDEPLSLVTNLRTSSVSSPSPLRQRREKRANAIATVTIPTIRPIEQLSISHRQVPLNFKVDSTKLANEGQAENIPRVPHHPAVRSLTISEINAQARESNTKSLPQVSHQHPRFNNDSMLPSSQMNAQNQHSAQNSANDINIPSTSTCNTVDGGSHESHQKSSSLYSQKEQRNYKNMTRERRIEANARERTRVHTISAAFDTLRKSIPAYSHNQKLSKLSVLRIACSYIMTLSRVAGNEPNLDEDEPSLSECISAVTRTIQTEGKLRKKKDDV